MPLAKTSLPDGIVIRLTFHVSTTWVPLALGKTLHTHIALIAFHFSKSVSTVQISHLYFSTSGPLIAADSGLFKGDFLLLPLALQRFPLSIIAGKRFCSHLSLCIFLPSFG